MAISRRSFLKGLFATGAVAAVPTILGQIEQKETLKDVNYSFGKSESKDVRLLMTCFFPMLRINEGELFHFYLCSSNKVSVGYGTNMEANTDWFQNVSLSRDGKKLSQEESQKCYDKMKALSKALAEKYEKLKKGTISKKEVEKERKIVKTELVRYTIQPMDALKLVEKGMKSFIGVLEKQIVNPKTKKSVFFDLPLCMQALALDIMYQIGPNRFEKYKKFKAALLARDFETATKESKVYLNKEKKTVSLDRERRKKRLIRVMKIAWANKEKPRLLKSLIEKDYAQNVPALTIRRTAKGIPYPYWERSANQEREVPCELKMAIGEINHMDLCRQRAIETVKNQKNTTSTNSVKNTKTSVQKMSRRQGR